MRLDKQIALVLRLRRERMPRLVKISRRRRLWPRVGSDGQEAQVRPQVRMGKAPWRGVDAIRRDPPHLPGTGVLRDRAPGAYHALGASSSLPPWWWSRLRARRGATVSELPAGGEPREHAALAGAPRCGRGLPPVSQAGLRYLALVSCPPGRRQPVPTPAARRPQGRLDAALAWCRAEAEARGWSQEAKGVARCEAGAALRSAPRRKTGRRGK